MLTDGEGSTRLWESASEAMGAAVARHYKLLGAAVALYGGVRPLEQGEGDSVVGGSSAALAAALDVQRAFPCEGWPEGVSLRLRIALHTAEAQLRDEANYFPLRSLDAVRSNPPGELTSFVGRALSWCRSGIAGAGAAAHVDRCWRLRQDPAGWRRGGSRGWFGGSGRWRRRKTGCRCGRLGPGGVGGLADEEAGEWAGGVHVVVGAF
jgi:hypothetical protein